MRLLVDTHILLCALGDPGRLDNETRSLLTEGENEIAFSVASIWEIAIKARHQRKDFGHRPEEIAQEARGLGFLELPITSDVASRVARLPLHHRDPFDRLLIAQAMAGPMRLSTADRALLPYSELVTLVG